MAPSSNHLKKSNFNINRQLKLHRACLCSLPGPVCDPPNIQTEKLFPLLNLHLSLLEVMVIIVVVILVVVDICEVVIMEAVVVLYCVGTSV